MSEGMVILLVLNLIAHLGVGSAIVIGNSPSNSYYSSSGEKTRVYLEHVIRAHAVALGQNFAITSPIVLWLVSTGKHPALVLAACGGGIYFIAKSYYKGVTNYLNEVAE